MVDLKSYRFKRDVRSSFAGETQACVETLDMLEFTKVFCISFLDSWKSLSDVESVLGKQPKSPVITDVKSLCHALERSEYHQPGIWLSDEQPQRSLQADNGWDMDSSVQVG